jgi:hypothetical protein
MCVWCWRTVGALRGAVLWYSLYFLDGGRWGWVLLGGGYTHFSTGYILGYVRGIGPVVSAQQASVLCWWQ